jgi:hypothetical protein
MSKITSAEAMRNFLSLMEGATPQCEEECIEEELEELDNGEEELEEKKAPQLEEEDEELEESFAISEGLNEQDRADLSYNLQGMIDDLQGSWETTGGPDDPNLNQLFIDAMSAMQALFDAVQSSGSQPGEEIPTNVY